VTRVRLARGKMLVSERRHGTIVMTEFPVVENPLRDGDEIIYIVDAKKYRGRSNAFERMVAGFSHESIHVALERRMPYHQDGVHWTLDYVTKKWTGKGAVASDGISAAPRRRR
jgi:hypothetical protein